MINNDLKNWNQLQQESSGHCPSVLENGHIEGQYIYSLLLKGSQLLESVEGTIWQI